MRKKLLHKNYIQIKYNIKALLPREGVIIECPVSGLFHDFLPVIIMSRTGVSEMVVNVSNVVIMIYG